MNLTTDDWIPIVWNGGTPGTVNLRAAFERGHEIQDLVLRPHERIAVMRLLICVAQAALDGPEDGDHWKCCRPQIVPKALEYLARWKHAFELFGTGQRFLQVANLKKPAVASAVGDMEGDNSNGKLDLTLASGNNHTLFDNAGGPERGLQDQRLAVQLLTFQCFSPCGTIGVALWNGNPTIGWSAYPKVKPGQSAHAPCLSGNLLHSFVRGPNLLATVHSNLLTKEQLAPLPGKDTWGRPVWETMPSGPTDLPAVQNATMSYLGRLVPMSRAVRLAENGRSMILANAMEYPAYPEWREPFATIVARTKNKQPSRAVLSVSVDKAAWRELHALTVIGLDKTTNGGPLTLRNIPQDADFDLWVGGLAAAGNGKLLDAAESVFHIPASMLSEPSQIVYEQGVHYAETASFRLGRAVCVYHGELGDHIDRNEMKTRRLQIQRHAAARFWTDVEQVLPLLLEVAAAPAALGLGGNWRVTAWGKSVQRAVRAAYEHACPHGTARQIRAYAFGLNTLFAQPAGNAEPEKEIES